MQRRAPQPTDETPRLAALIAGEPWPTTAILVVSLAGWVGLTWMAVDMGHPLVGLTMPGSSDWSAANLLAILLM